MPEADRPAAPPGDAARVKWPQHWGGLRAGRHVLPVRVYYEDTDFTGVVYHANYLRFMERARTEFLRLIGIAHPALFAAATQETPNFGFAVRTMKIDFFKPAHMDDLLEVITEPNEVKGASVRVRQWVVRGEDTLVAADIRVAFIAAGRAAPIPRPLRLALEAGADAGTSPQGEPR
jgi:acyl-CoA thioester hydrolase